ncbi:hypothetical protein NO134_02985 [Ochrobactrum sp. BD22]
MQPHRQIGLVGLCETPIGVCYQTIFLFDRRVWKETRKIEGAASGDFEIVFCDRKPFFTTGTGHCEANE